jgi:hypothetical protein
VVVEGTVVVKVEVSVKKQDIDGVLFVNVVDDGCPVLTLVAPIAAPMT